MQNKAWIPIHNRLSSETTYTDFNQKLRSDCAPSVVDRHHFDVRPKITMPTTTPNLDALRQLSGNIQAYSPPDPHSQFLKEEALRFLTIGGTLAGTFQNSEAPDIAARTISHILMRSALENFFRAIYIFEDSAQSQTRYEQLVDGFKRDYAKLHNDLPSAKQNAIESPQSGWNQLQRAPDANSLLAQTRNNNSERYDFLYFTYRIASFDTHGTTLKCFFDSAFSKDCDFPFLEMHKVLELIADYYVCHLKPLVSASDTD